MPQPTVLADVLEVVDGQTFRLLGRSNDLINIALQGPRVYVNTYDEGVGRFDGASWRHWYPVFCNGAECDSTYNFPIYPYALQVGGALWRLRRG